MGARVGVTYRNPEKVKPYAEALARAGLEPVLMPASLDGLGGLLLTGGTDINPKLYRQERHAASDEPDDERDAMEKALLEEALRRDLPVLAICRGMQLFNVVHGGTLLQHVEGHKQPGMAEAHRVTVEPGTRLAAVVEPGTHAVNSRHHQAVGDVGQGLVVAARAEDGCVEGLERADLTFAIAVQWHPEDVVGSSVDARRLFEAFAEAATRYAKSGFRGVAKIRERMS